LSKTKVRKGAARWYSRVQNRKAWYEDLPLLPIVVGGLLLVGAVIIVVVSLHRDYLPSSWGVYHGTIFDWATFGGSIGLFLALMFLFIRLLPMISIFEMRAILPEAQRAEHEE